MLVTLLVSQDEILRLKTDAPENIKLWLRRQTLYIAQRGTRVKGIETRG